MDIQIKLYNKNKFSKQTTVKLFLKTDSQQ
jgi:hypothetical protein